ncbi:helix-turn-helix domain-containing protein [Streptomyces sp. NRRL F-2664]|uniref:helix-turn-helix domain-containing protein n=1 Tax=Streptomyces sp. NRRL F-2664 TaxID=1463842 RepID=UPI0004CA1768|nr:helix-turn-helix domain-containing protein [Streptomyces sp. NRRL F-2664]
MTRSVEGLPAPHERRRLREAAELTLDEVAAAVGVTASTVRSWESGRTTPRGRKHHAYVRFLTGLAVPQAAAEAAAEATGPPDRPVRTAPAAAGAPEAAGASGAVAEAPDAVLAAVASAGGAEGLAPTAEAPAAISGTADTGGPAASATTAGTGEPAATAGTAATVDAAGPAAADATAPAVLDARPPTASPLDARPARDPAEAFDALHERAAPALARQTYLLTGSRALALEAVDRAFTRAWDQWPEVATDPDPVGWVRAIAYDYALSPWHRFRRAHRRPDRPPADPADRILLDALLALPAAHRRTVLLYDGVGLDLPDTAAESEATTPATGNRILNAHAELAVRVPELAGVPVEKQSAALRERLVALRPPFPLDPRPAAAIRGSGERRTRHWTRATLGLTAMITAATAYTAATAPTRYDPPLWPGESVSGVPPLSGPQQLTEQSRQLHDKLRADPLAGPARVVPGLD